MRRSKIKVGSYYKIQNSHSIGWGGVRITNPIGKCIGYSSNGLHPNILIQFIDYINGHDGNSCFSHKRGKYGYCWYVNPRDVLRELKNIDEIRVAML